MTDDDVVAVRFYEWCLLDAAREQREGFALLRRFEDHSARAFFRAIRGLSAAEQSEFMSALVRRSHEHAMALKGESLSERDKMWINRYREICDEVLGAFNPPAGCSLERQQELMDRFLERLKSAPPPPRPEPVERGQRLTAGQLAKALKASPSPPLPSQKFSREYGIIMKYSYREHTIRTTIDFGGAARNLGFFLSLSDSEGRRLLWLVDPLNWLGITRSDWSDLRSDQAPMVVETIAASLMRFCCATDYILDGNLPTGEVGVR
jgi:hypothetical protein